MKKIKLIIVLLLFSQLISAQDRVVRGVVKDTLGVPLLGVNIVVKGTSRSTQTDSDGEYSIKAKGGEILVFSFIDFISQSIVVSLSDINVKLRSQDHSNDCIPISFSLYKPPKKYKSYAALVRPKGYKKELRKVKRAEKAAKRDLENIDNPKYNFRKGKRQGYVIYFKDPCYYKKDQDFQQKYKVALVFSTKQEYAEAYNKLVFRYLNKKYKKAWQAEIRKDVFGLKDL